jgi:hypothetical protein
MIDFGSQVVCIDDEWVTGGGVLPPGIILPIKGQIYTVREAFIPPCIYFNFNRVYLRFEEFYNKPTYEPLLGQDQEASFLIDHFRPVKKTDISQFTVLLNPVEPKQLEPV